MKKAWNKFSDVLVVVLTVLAIAMMIFSLISTFIFDRNERSLFGYRMMVVLSDSMSATDFDSGDLIFVKKGIDPMTLQPGDIVSYISQDPANYGQTVTHKIKRTTLDADGTLGFITYGTTSGKDDSTVVAQSCILGKYAGKLPKVGTFFAYLKTVPGYVMFILLPFGLLILTQSVKCVRDFREYREEEMTELREERERLKLEREKNSQLLARLEQLEQLQEQTDSGEKGEWTDGENEKEK